MKLDKVNVIIVTQYFGTLNKISTDTVSKIQWFSLRNRYLIKCTGTPFIQDEICQNYFLQQFV